MSDTPNKWALPEFGLVTHAHHNTYKKLKSNHNASPNALASQAQGYEKGYNDGMAKALQEMNLQKKRLEDLIAQLHQEATELQQHKEQSLFAFVKNLCEKVIYRELSLSDEVLSNIIVQALKSIDNTGNDIRIYCHPKLYEKIRNTHFENNTRIVFEMNNQLPDFEFKLESEKQKICFSIETLLNKLLEEILACNSQR
ncbi:MAG: FliH/SctL family protein [Candidatus Berkiella sp.]